MWIISESRMRLREMVAVFSEAPCVLERGQKGRVPGSAWLSKEDTWRERLTAWLAKQRKQGVRKPLVTSEVVRLID